MADYAVLETGHVAYGNVEGTGAALAVSLGFEPKIVRLLNIDGLATLEWVAGMGNATGLKQVTAGTLSFIAVNGITPNSSGFTIGADTDINVTAETIFYEAIG